MNKVRMLVVLASLSASSVMSAAANFGNAEDLVSLIKELPAEKGEFESTADYSARLQKVERQPHVITGVPKNISYDADREVFTIQTAFRPVVRCKTDGTYKAHTRMNVEFVVTKTDCEGFYLDMQNFGQIPRTVEIHESRASAPSLKSELTLRYRFSITKNTRGDLVKRETSRYATSLDEPLEGSRIDYTLTMVLDEPQVLELSTGKLLYATSL